MLSRIAKALLVASSLAPMIFGYGVVGWGEGKSWKTILPMVAIAFILGALAYWLPKIALNRIQPQQMPLKSVKDADKEILTFLITYLLPFAGNTVKTNPYSLIGIYVFSMIFLSVYHTNAFTFNPLLAILGYHFYEIETETGMKYLLVSKNIIRKQAVCPWVVPLSNYVYLEGKDPNP